MKIWTFLIRGGETFCLLKPRAHYHNGQISVWQVEADAKDVLELEVLIKSFGAEVDTFTQNRPLREHCSDEEYEYRTPRCGLCYFFDPGFLTECGLENWAQESLEAAFQNPKAVEDRDLCPLRR